MPHRGADSQGGALRKQFAGCSLWAAVGTHGSALGSWPQGPLGARALGQARARVWAAYRDPRVAGWAGWAGNTGAEEPAGPGLAPLPFLPSMSSVTLLSLWTERLVWGSPALTAGPRPVLTPRALGGRGSWKRVEPRPGGPPQHRERVPPTFISAPSWKRSSGNCPAGDMSCGLSGVTSGPRPPFPSPTPSSVSLSHAFPVPSGFC